MLPIVDLSAPSQWRWTHPWVAHEMEVSFEAQLSVHVPHLLTEPPALVPLDELPTEGPGPP